MADSALDRPNSKGWLASGEDKSMLGVCREEFARNWGSTPGAILGNGLSSTGIGAFFGVLIALIPTLGTRIIADSITTSDAGLVYGLSRDRGHVVIDLNGEDLALFRQGDEYQVYRLTEGEKTGEGEMRYIAGMPDAIEVIDNTVALIDLVQERLQSGQTTAGVDLPGFQSLQDVTVAYDRGGDSIARLFKGTVTDSRVNTDYNALLAQVRGELTQARGAILDGGYGAEQLRESGIATGKTDGRRLALTVGLAIVLLGATIGFCAPTMGAISGTRARIRKNKGLDKK